MIREATPKVHVRALGDKQLQRLSMMAHIGNALVVPDDLSRSLCKRGLMLATGDVDGARDGFIVITPNGLRALADAMDAGRVAWKPDWAKIRAERAGGDYLGRIPGPKDACK